MNLNFIEASSLAQIDRQIAKAENKSLEYVSPAQYETIRQVIYHTADLEYQSLLKFSPGALAKGAAALSALTPIIVDVPEIQVSIVPQLQQTFGNSVYCCATNNTRATGKTTKAAQGLEKLASRHPQSIIVIGQDETAMSVLVNLVKNKAIEPSLTIVTPATFVQSDVKQKLIQSSTPNICSSSNKGGANVAAAILNSLIKLTWRAYSQD